ncbi:MAG: FecR domain-containing protein [Acidobacteria bacterium]|nr:FecR domain-containing protein [Acidobacteriota bacterium]
MTTPSTPSRFLLPFAFVLSLFVFVQADTPIIRMARISVIEGEVSYRRANQEDQNSWYDASTNTPLSENDQVFTGQRGRAEIQLTGRNIVRLDSDTSFKIAQFTTAVTQISLPVGTAVFRVDSLDPRQFDVVDANDVGSNDPLFFEVNTPTVAVTLLKPGIYRISVADDGTTEVNVRSGEAEVYNQELDTITVKKGRRIVVEGNNAGDYRLAKLEDKDSFDRWSERRDDELAIQADSLSARYVPQGIPGVYDLDRHGDWWYTSDYGYVWSPRSIASDWSPYRVGSWQWYSDWGWTWVSTEPWGWTPYHYGRWSYYRSRWCWIPRGGLSAGFSWSPALVTWFGWGNGNYNRGYNNGYRDGYRDGRYDSVGWVPLGPGEHYYNPHWRGGNTTIVNNNYNTRIDNYRNYNAPGGVIRMDGRRFDTRRIAVNNIDNTPVQQPILRSAITARGDSFRPVAGQTPGRTVNPAADPSRRPSAQRDVFTRDGTRGGRMIAPGENRSGSVVNGTPSLRNSDVPDRMARPDRTNRDSGRDNSRDSNRDFGNRNAETNTNRTTMTPDSSTWPNRSGNRETYSGDRNSNQGTRRIERPVTPAPTPTPETPANNNRVERPQRPFIFGGNNRNEENRRDTTPPDYSSRRTETERREAPPRRVEETPRPAPRQEAPREYRREERQVPREQPRYERPSPPPAPRQEAPRQEARPSPPPSSHDGGGRTERPSRRPPSE